MSRPPGRPRKHAVADVGGSVYVRFNPDEFSQLREVARADDRTNAQFVRHAVRKELARLTRDERSVAARKPSRAAS